MSCPHPVYDYAAGERLCGRPTLPGSDRCWRHSPDTAALRSRAAQSAARTRKRRRSLWGRIRSALGFPVRAAPPQPTPAQET